MDVTLSTELEELIDSKVASGHYASRMEVIGHAVRLLAEQDLAREARCQQLRREIVRGLEQLDRGEGVPLDIEAIKLKARQLRDAQPTMKPR